MELICTALSPDGDYLALSLKEEGIWVIDIATSTVIAKSIGACSNMAFSPDSSKLLCVGGLWGARLLDLNAGTLNSLTVSETVGRTGIRLEKRQGKLLVTELPRHLSASQDTIQIGDELLAIRPGEKPISDDFQEWKTLLGKSIDDAIKLITGPPGTYVQLRVARAGQPGKLEFAVQRMWPATMNRPRVTDSQTLTVNSRFGNVALLSAPSGTDYANVHLQYVKDTALTAISADARLMAFVGELRSERGYGLEIHDLVTGSIRSAIELELQSIQQVRFAGDSKQLLIGTRDSVEFFDVAENKWGKNLLLVPESERDHGEVVQRRMYGGFGFPGDLYLTVPEVVYGATAALSKFDVSHNGTLAIASEDGKVVLASLEQRKIIDTVGEKLFDAAPELLQFTPDGRHLIAYADGILYVIRKGSAAR